LLWLLISCSEIMVSTSSLNAASRDVAYVDDEVVCCRDNDDGGESSGEVVRVVCDRFILSLERVSKKSRQCRGQTTTLIRMWLWTTRNLTHLLKLRPELVERVTVGSIGYSDVVDVLEASDVELIRTFED
jgi:hypothetical protein